MKPDKNQFLEGAKAVFKDYPHVDKVIATGDGNFFLPNALSLAKNHCNKFGVQLFEITRKETQCAEPSTDPAPVDLVPADDAATKPKSKKK